MSRSPWLALALYAAAALALSLLAMALRCGRADRQPTYEDIVRGEVAP